MIVKPCACYLAMRSIVHDGVLWSFGDQSMPGLRGAGIMV